MEPKQNIRPDNELAPDLYAVAREGGTETPFTGKYVQSHERGMFRCAVCGVELFSSDTKFDSETGWQEPISRTPPTRVARDFFESRGAPRRQ